ncbi:Stk1 family PASTA domain-containing Ser/Thr kinase [Vallicoccus soli]|uniref:non-specific serine/threonine protein kinase n=1 Tax=Vallicoccus soli TaxID=2339232 RepID=A0A3A3YXN7_9ACTN|nr:Stk1 family PASTA domain-containing Ser/Thr kinase [Vallicoccus soli]RJK94723.1 Stk1 family PASTA domain-containing Ser/Thr kinase [Vallicoccus soli]
MTEPTTLGGRYELGDVLGRGGMAEVHVGRDTRLGRQVAVKMLRVDLARDPSSQARFRREAQSAASLNHPSVVAVYDTGEDTVAGGSVPYIVMEYVDGSTLRDLLNSGRRLLPERALEIVSGVLEALDYSHRHGIVHRDIKPANVMLTEAGDIKVMDFGIARAVSDASATMTQTSAVIGTAQYLSPEQARGETVDARSDLYSTGCLLYELLVGRPPFVGDSPVSVAYQHVREEPQPPSAYDADIPPEIDAIVLKALAKDREQRYQSAAEMRADIDRALAGRPVEAPAPAPVTQRLAPIVDPTPTASVLPAGADEEPRRRTGLWVGLGLLAVAVFVGALLLGLNLFGDDEQAGASTTVSVPNVVGEQVARAEQLITGAGLTVDQVDSEPSDDPSGTVLSSSPAAATEVQEGTAVDLVVSEGQETATVPTLVGSTLDEATAALASNGLLVGDVESRDAEEDEGEVLEASVQAGEEVPVGTTVDLVVSTGRTAVPDVTGQTEDDATDALEGAGFEVDTTTREDATAPEGTVIGQSPAAGTSQRTGTTITLTLAVAPPPEPTPEESPTEEPTEEPTDGPTGAEEPADGATPAAGATPAG